MALVTPTVIGGHRTFFSKGLIRSLRGCNSFVTDPGSSDARGGAPGPWRLRPATGSHRGLADRLTGTLPPHGWGQTTTAAPGLSS